jgi:dipeptidyl aminopeptidase/acylaminoacyl peptidase
LVYVRQFQDVNIWSLHLPGATGASGPPTLLAASSRLDTNPDFSPDGRRITFQSDRSGSLEIWTCDRNGFHARQLTFFGYGFTGSPRWSPDGQWIAFDSGVEGKFAIYTVRAEGGRPKRLTDLAFENNVPSWSQDSQWIYFSSERSGRAEIWKMPVQGGPPVQVTQHGGLVVAESRDGRTLYYLRGLLGDGRRTLPASLWQMPTDGGPEHKVLDAVVLRNFTVGEQGIYYERPEPPSGWTIRFRNFATGADVEIGQYTKRPYMGMSLSPDRHTLLFAQIDHEGSDLMEVDNVR